MSKTREEVIHLGDAGAGALKCGAKEIRDNYGNKNWTWTPEKVTCKECKRIYKSGLQRHWGGRSR